MFVICHLSFVICSCGCVGTWLRSSSVKNWIFFRGRSKFFNPRQQQQPITTNYNHSPISLLSRLSYYTKLIVMTKELPSGYFQGPFRPYKTFQPSLTERPLSKFEQFAVFSILLISLIRLYKLYIPDRVVFDEIHLIKYIKNYYDGSIFVDIHPPLGKLIYFYITKLFLFDKDFQIDIIGDLYPEDFPYLWLRLFSGICGIGHVLLTFFTLRITCNLVISIVITILICLENSMVTVSRLILLEGPSLFVQSLVIYNYKAFTTRIPFTGCWYFNLFVTGIALGLNISLKISGLFTFAWVGILTCVQLWEILGDLRISIWQFIKHLVLRVVAFIMVPLTIYCSVFYIHFENLPNEGPGSGFLTPHFRSTLDDYQQQPLQVLYGSTITIKHNALEKYLHSHDLTYPRGSNLQQVTLYDFPDVNNEWVIETKQKYNEEKLMTDQREVKDGDVVRLYHKATGHYLHVNDIRPPISEHEYSYEVNGNETRGLLGNEDYEFKIRMLVKKPHAENDLPLIKLRTTETIFQLIHQATRCNLMSHEQKLPDWGEYQNEVLCVKEPTIPNTLWYVELSSHPLLKDTKKLKTFPKFSFWSKLIETHKVMFNLNKGFTNPHPYASKPLDWPLLSRGIAFFSNYNLKSIDEESSLIYYLGNVAIYYLVFFVGLIAIFKCAIYSFIKLNPYASPPSSSKSSPYANFYNNSWPYLVGWFINYIPYCLMSRNLYLHHYLLALNFGILLLSQYLNYRVAKNKIIGGIITATIFVSAIYCFYEFIPITYGLPWTLDQCNSHKWFPNWNIDCMTYTG